MELHCQTLHKKDDLMSQRLSQSMGEEAPVGHSKTPVYKFNSYKPIPISYSITSNTMYQRTCFTEKHWKNLTASSFRSHLNSIFLTYSISMLASSLETLSKFYNCLSFLSLKTNMCPFLSFTLLNTSSNNFEFFSFLFCSIHYAFNYYKCNLIILGWEITSNPLSCTTCMCSNILYINDVYIKICSIHLSLSQKKK